MLSVLGRHKTVGLWRAGCIGLRGRPVSRGVLWQSGSLWGRRTVCSHCENACLEGSTQRRWGHAASMGAEVC